jgi:hypothetical protein
MPGGGPRPAARPGSRTTRSQSQQGAGQLGAPEPEIGHQDDPHPVGDPRATAGSAPPPGCSGSRSVPTRGSCATIAGPIDRRPRRRPPECGSCAPRPSPGPPTARPCTARAARSHRSWRRPRRRACGDEPAGPLDLVLAPSAPGRGTADVGAGGAVRGYGGADQLGEGFDLALAEGRTYTQNPGQSLSNAPFTSIRTIELVLAEEYFRRSSYGPAASVRPAFAARTPEVKQTCDRDEPGYNGEPRCRALDSNCETGWLL